MANVVQGSFFKAGVTATETPETHRNASKRLKRYETLETPKSPETLESRRAGAEPRLDTIAYISHTTRVFT